MSWEIESAAKRVLRLLKRKPYPDHRLRSGTIAGQMQEIYLNSKYHEAKTLSEKELIKIWRENFQEKHEIEMLEKNLYDLRRRRNRLDVQIAQAKRQVEDFRRSRSK